MWSFLYNIIVFFLLQNEEWEKFQNDLLTSVRVANDFKTEAQQNVQKLILENKAERERIKLLEAQIDKLKGRILIFSKRLFVLIPRLYLHRQYKMCALCDVLSVNKSK